jgi:hypothetical protein
MAAMTIQYHAGWLEALGGGAERVGDGRLSVGNNTESSHKFNWPHVPEISMVRGRPIRKPAYIQSNPHGFS